MSHLFDSIDLASYPPTVVVEGKYRDVRFSCRIHFYHLYYRNALLIVLTTCNKTLFPLNKIESTCFPPSKIFIFIDTKSNSSRNAMPVVNQKSTKKPQGGVISRKTNVISRNYDVLLLTLPRFKLRFPRIQSSF